MLKKILLRSVPFCVIFLGIVIRFAWIFYMKTYPETDFMWYHVKGVELSCNMGFLNGIYPFYTGKIGCPTAFRPIGYPLTLAILYSIFGTNFLVAKIFNILLSTLSMISLYKLCKMLDASFVLIIFGGYSGYSGDDVNKFIWMIRIAAGYYPRVKEENFLRNGYRVDAGASDTMLNCMMYSFSFYRFDENAGIINRKILDGSFADLLDKCEIIIYIPTGNIT